ncbi:hypothetical protein CLAIMM_08043 [Cladophialophora immunda]|nr:hypothetical protein CLAIMM_08043 [Cladophialophora immunda]
MASSNPLTGDNSNPPTLLQLNNFKLPNEIISQVISGFVPHAGLCISNDPDYDADLDTIRRLLKTSLDVKQETLRQIFNKPLNVYITNGKRCDCFRMREDSPAGSSSVHPLNRLVYLPLIRWKEVKICFAPKASQTPCPRIQLDQKYPGASLPKLYSLELDYAAQCVAAQSKALGCDLWHLRGSFLRLRAVNFKIVFEKLKAGYTWNLGMVGEMLDFWRWTIADQSGTGPTRLELPQTTYAITNRYRLSRLARDRP